MRTWNPTNRNLYLSTGRSACRFARRMRRRCGRPRRALSGETKLLLVQIAAALLLAAAVALGLRLGGKSFRERYREWIGYRSIDLNAWLTPIVPDSSEPPTDAASAG